MGGHGAKNATQLFKELLQELAQQFPECNEFFAAHPRSPLPPPLFLAAYEKILGELQNREAFEEHFKASKLSPVEYAYLLLVAAGFTRPEMAEIFGTRSQTVRNTITNVYLKLEQATGKRPDRTEIIQDKIQGLVPPFLLESWVIKIDPQNLRKLGRREKEVLRLLQDGLRNKEIAYKLRIRVSTVKSYIQNIAQKLGLETPQLRRTRVNPRD